MLAVLSLAYICSGADRLIITLLVDPIQADLAITDTQFGFLQAAFFLLYSLAVLPAGYISDRTHRLRFAAVGVAAWSLLTGLCGMAQNFLTLCLSRIGVGIGEATLSPAAYSLFGDIFPKERLGLVMGVYQSLAGFGSGIMLILGGALIAAFERVGPVDLPMVGQVAPWQMTFLVLMLPGIGIALLLAMLKEPSRNSSRPGVPGASRHEMVAFYQSNKLTLALHHLAVCLTGLVLTGMISWNGALLSRAYFLNPMETGAISGLAMISGATALLGAGALSDRLSRRGSRARFSLCALAGFVGSFAAIALAHAPDATTATLLAGIVIVCACTPYGAASAALQVLAPSRMRGVVSAVFLLTYSFMSAAGPVLIGAVADSYFSTPAGIRDALGIVLPVASLVSAIAFLLLVRPFDRAVQSGVARPSPILAAVAEQFK